MQKDIFISYSRRDQEFVMRLAADLNQHVAGVWFDQSTIQAGQNWHDEILQGIRECTAFILVLSPDAEQSRYVREEVHTALELGKPIFPVIYRSAQWTDEFEPLVKDIQTINLHSGSYTDNFYKLVDGLIEAGAIKTASFDRPFLRKPEKIGLSVVLKKTLGWAFVWSMGWLLFWSMTFAFLFILIAVQNKAGWEDILNLLTVSLGGMAGGFVGGFFAGLLSMLVLRPYAPSIFWKHISPTIRIWAISGPIGMIISGALTVIMLIIGVINPQNEYPNCQGLDNAQCLSQIAKNAYSEDMGTILIIITIFFLFVIAIWFLTGTFAGWLVVRHVRRLEPGITRGQAWRVSMGWGCGAIVAAVMTLLIIGIIAKTFGL
jgi:hypothetical protein